MFDKFFFTLNLEVIFTMKKRKGDIKLYHGSRKTGGVNTARTNRELEWNTQGL